MRTVFGRCMERCAAVMIHRALETQRGSGWDGVPYNSANSKCQNLFTGAQLPHSMQTRSGALSKTKEDLKLAANWGCETAEEMSESGWAGAEAIIAWSRKKKAQRTPKRKSLTFYWLWSCVGRWMSWSAGRNCRCEKMEGGTLSRPAQV